MVYSPSFLTETFLVQQDLSSVSVHGIEALIRERGQDVPWRESVCRGSVIPGSYYIKLHTGKGKYMEISYKLL